MATPAFAHFPVPEIAFRCPPVPIAGEDEIRQQQKESVAKVTSNLLWGFVINDLDGKYEMLARIDHHYLHEACDINLGSNLICCLVESEVVKIIDTCHNVRAAMAKSPDGMINTFPFLVRRGPVEETNASEACKRVFDRTVPEGAEIRECVVCKEHVPDFEHKQWCKTDGCSAPIHVDCLSKGLYTTGKCPICREEMHIIGFKHVTNRREMFLENMIDALRELVNEESESDSSESSESSEEDGQEVE